MSSTVLNICDIRRFFTVLKLIFAVLYIIILPRQFKKMIDFNTYI